MIPTETDDKFEMYLMLDKDRIDMRDLRHLVGIINEIITSRSMKPLTDRLGIKLPEK